MYAHGTVSRHFVCLSLTPASNHTTTGYYADPKQKAVTTWQQAQQDSVDTLLKLAGLSAHQQKVRDRQWQQNGCGAICALRLGEAVLRVQTAWGPHAYMTLKHRLLVLAGLSAQQQQLGDRQWQ
jgi:hypothetical protein